MSDRPPTFTGYVPAESVVKFLEDFDIYCAIKLFTNVQRLSILGAVLRGPAKAEYQAKTNDGTIAAGTDGNAETAAGQTLANAIAWLRATYHTADIQQNMKDQLMTTYQGINKSPLTFHTRILHMVGLAGYTDAIKEQVIEQTFMNGIHKELAIQVQSSPITLTHTQKVDYAQRYWAARNPGQDVMQQVLPTALQNPVAPDSTTTADAPQR